MKLTLYRKWLSEQSTIGEIHVNGGFFCFALEDCLRAPGLKIPGQTAIPAGVYDVILNFSNRFQRIMPLLANVPGWAGIRVHPGNTATDTSGCILVGRKHVGRDSIAESRAAYADLFNLLNEVYGKEKITIEIVNPQSAIRERVQTIPVTAAQRPTAAQEKSALINEQDAPPPNYSPASPQRAASSTPSPLVPRLTITQRITDALVGSGSLSTKWATFALLAWPLWNQFAEACASAGIALPSKGQLLTLAIAIGRLLIQRGAK